MAPEKRTYAKDHCDGIEDEYCPGFRFGIDDKGCCQCTQGGCLPDLYNSDMFTDPPYSVCEGCNYDQAQECLLIMQDKSLDTRELFNEEMPQCDLSMVSHERNINCCYPADVDAPNPFQQFQICMVGIGCANSDLAKSVAIQKLAYGCDNELSAGYTISPSWLFTFTIVLSGWCWSTES